MVVFFTPKKQACCTKDEWYRDRIYEVFFDKITHGDITLFELSEIKNCIPLSL